MKSSRAILMLLLSLVAGVAAVLLASQWMSKNSDIGDRRIAVIARDVDIGQVLGPHNVELVPWAATAMPRGAFSDPKLLNGRVVISTMQRGELVLESRLAAVGSRAGLSAVIPEGKRAISVKVNEVVGVAGFALPGSHVDVMVNTQDDRQKPVSKIVLERILVLAIAQEANRDENKPRVVSAVTLEVTPEQAERLDLARSVGTLSLVLRNQLDTVSADTAGIRKSDLLNDAVVVVPPPAAPQPAPVAVAKPRPRPVERVSAPAPAPAPVVAAPEQRSTVEVIRGVQRSSAQL
jgi:pilus assembly protein CpaB